MLARILLTRAGAMADEVTVFHAGRYLIDVRNTLANHPPSLCVRGRIDGSEPTLLEHLLRAGIDASSGAMASMFSLLQMSAGVTVNCLAFAI